MASEGLKATRKIKVSLSGDEDSTATLRFNNTSDKITVLRVQSTDADVFSPEFQYAYVKPNDKAMVKFTFKASGDHDAFHFAKKKIHFKTDAFQVDWLGDNAPWIKQLEDGTAGPMRQKRFDHFHTAAQEKGVEIHQIKTKPQYVDANAKKARSVKRQQKKGVKALTKKMKKMDITDELEDYYSDSSSDSGSDVSSEASEHVDDPKKEWDTPYGFQKHKCKVIIKHKDGKGLKVNPDTGSVKVDGGHGRNAKFIAYLDKQAKTCMLQSMEAETFLRVNKNGQTVDCKGTKDGSKTIWRYHTQDKGNIVRLEAQGFAGKFLTADGDGVRMSSKEDDDTVLTFYKKK